MFLRSLRHSGHLLPLGVTVALWLKGLGHERWFYWYATVVIAASLVVYWRMPDTRAASLIEED